VELISSIVLIDQTSVGRALPAKVSYLTLFARQTKESPLAMLLRHGRDWNAGIQSTILRV